MRDDEFVSRNRQLPASLDQSQAFATSANARNDFNQTPVGTPPDCYDVRSIFDSRPVNGYDFNITGSLDFSGNNNGVIFFAVPEGLVAVVRDVDMWFEPAPTFPGTPQRSLISATLQLNGGDLPQNGPVFLGSAGSFSTFVIGDEFNVIGLRVVFVTPMAGQNIVGFAQFHGSILVKTDRAANFEIANRVMSGDCSPAPPRPKVSSIAPAPPQAAAHIPTSVPAQPTAISAPAQPAPRIGVVNVVSSGGGRGGQKIGVHDPKNATAPGGFRAISRAEYVAYQRDFDIELQKLKKFAPSAQLWLA